MTSYPQTVEQAMLPSYKQIEEGAIDELMENTGVRCGCLSQNNVYFCSSPKLQKDRPSHMSEEQWGKCPLYRLQAFCTNQNGTCGFY